MPVMSDRQLAETLQAEIDQRIDNHTAEVVQLVGVGRMEDARLRAGRIQALREFRDVIAQTYNKLNNVPTKPPQRRTDGNAF